MTDRNQCNGRPLDEVVGNAVEGGANIVQLREKDLPAGELLALAERLRAITAGRAMLFVNDRLDVALACGADGVQLGEESLPLEAARKVAGNRLLLSRSVHSVEGAVEAEGAPGCAERRGADLLIVGTIFPTGSHPGAEAAGVQLLRQVRERVRIPFLAIGGVNADNIESMIRSGASGAAVISTITRSDDPEGASRELMEKIKGAWKSTREARA
ncbi:MAG: thiamine phosphate synthase [Ardenticatenaceae bacterium]